MDVAFLVDSSGSMDSKGYQKQKTAVKVLANSLDLSLSGRAALILYSNSASIKARFGQYDSNEVFQNAVDQLPHEKGRTRIDLALVTARRQIFVDNRRGAAKVAVILTDGKQTPDPNAKGVRELSRSLRRDGVRLLAIGVEPGVDPKELRSMVGRDDDLVLTSSFDDLLLQIRNLSRMLCSVAGLWWYRVSRRRIAMCLIILLGDQFASRRE